MKEVRSSQFPFEEKSRERGPWEGESRRHERKRERCGGHPEDRGSEERRFETAASPEEERKDEKRKRRHEVTRPHREPAVPVRVARVKEKKRHRHEAQRDRRRPGQYTARKVEGAGREDQERRENEETLR